MSDWLERSLGLAPALEVLLAQGQAAERKARWDVARACYETVLHQLQPAAEPAAVATLIRWIARAYVEDGDAETASDCLDAALAVAERSGDRACIAHVLNLQAIALQRGGELEEAGLVYGRARDIALELGDAKLVAIIDQNLGTIANIRGELRVALKHYHSSLAAYRSLGAGEYLGRVLNNLGMLYTDSRRWKAAERTYEQAADAARAARDLNAQIFIEVNRAEMWIARRRYEEARVACNVALRLAQEVGDPGALGETYKHYGVIFRELGEHRLSEDYFGRADQLARGRGDLLLQAETARERADLYSRQQRNRETLLSLNRAHQLFTALRARRDAADIDGRIGRLEVLFLDIVRGWGESIESKDRYTQGHCERVSAYACALAQAEGLDEKTLFWFRLGALLHDVGKIVVPGEILNKPGPLTPEERQVMMRHPDAGVQLLEDIEFPWDIRPMVRHHHERWDGSGYPTGLAGEKIPDAARILCVADVYDALTTTRSYRGGFSHDRALEIMQGDIGRIFDPHYLHRFLEIVGDIAVQEAGPPAGADAEVRQAIAV